MDHDELWVEIPATFGHESFARLEHAFAEADLEFDSATRNVGVGPQGAETVYVFHLFRDHARTGARILRDVLELEDPAQALPFAGACPSCDAAVDDAWECPSCGLGFRPPYDPRDPFFVFLREQGAFPDARLDEVPSAALEEPTFIARALRYIWPERATPARRVFGIVTGVVMIPPLVLVGLVCLLFLPFALLARRRLRQEVGGGGP